LKTIISGNTFRNGGIGSYGIKVEDCTNVEIDGNTIVGSDQAIIARRIINLNASSNFIASKTVTNSSNPFYMTGLLLALHLRAETPPEMIRETLQKFRENSANPVLAKAELEHSTLKDWLEVGADLSTFYDSLSKFANSDVSQQFLEWCAS
jgi:hypothetical protein